MVKIFKQDGKVPKLLVWDTKHQGAKESWYSYIIAEVGAIEFVCELLGARIHPGAVRD